MMDKPIQVYALTRDQQAKFRHAPMPEVKKITVEKHGAEGEAMMKALLDAIETASE